jgi:beta-glucanase (GH16 family)
MTLHNRTRTADHQSVAVGFDGRFSNNFYAAYHDIGVLWTPTDIVFEVDGKAVAAISTDNSIHGKADIRFSTAAMDYAGKVQEHPEGHPLSVRSLRVYSAQAS